MRIAIKFSCAVPDIDQLILLLSIPQIWNLERIISHSLGGDLFICKDPHHQPGLIYSRSNRGNK